MLVLTRKANERIMIGDNIVITIVRVMHNKVKIGIDAPKDVTVSRDELLSPGTVEQVLRAAIAPA